MALRWWSATCVGAAGLGAIHGIHGAAVAQWALHAQSYVTVRGGYGGEVAHPMGHWVPLLVASEW